MYAHIMSKGYESCDKAYCFEEDVMVTLIFEMGLVDRAHQDVNTHMAMGLSFDQIWNRSTKQYRAPNI